MSTIKNWLTVQFRANFLYNCKPIHKNIIRFVSIISGIFPYKYFNYIIISNI